MTTSLPAVTAIELPNGKTRYEVDGDVHTAASRKTYTHASVYQRTGQLSEYDRKMGRVAGELIVFLHTRADIAAKGSTDANRIVAHGAWTRVPGVVEIAR